MTSKSKLKTSRWRGYRGERGREQAHFHPLPSHPYFSGGQSAKQTGGERTKLSFSPCHRRTSRIVTVDADSPICISVSLRMGNLLWPSRRDSNSRPSDYEIRRSTLLGFRLSYGKCTHPGKTGVCPLETNLHANAIASLLTRCKRYILCRLTCFELLTGESSFDSEAKSK